jgi:hypothetical protein
MQVVNGVHEEAGLVFVFETRLDPKLSTANFQGRMS